MMREPWKGVLLWASASLAGGVSALVPVWASVVIGVVGGWLWATLYFSPTLPREDS